MKVDPVDLTPSVFLRPHLDAAYERVMSSGVYIGGLEVESFEHEWSDYCQQAYCVACGNGFDALQLVLRSEGIGDGYDVIVPEWTAPPTWHAVTALGARPVLRDYDQIYWYDIEIIAHLYGERCTPKLSNTYVVEDCAQAHGLKNFKHTACWSFYPTKNLGAYGDAGAITTNDYDLALELRRLRSYNAINAVNSRMDPLQAAFLRAKLSFLDIYNAIRLEQAQTYNAGLHDLTSFIVLPDINAESVWHQYVIRVSNRYALQRDLLDNDIATLVHYPVSPSYNNGRDATPRQINLANTVLSLPLGPHLTHAQIEYVIHTIRRYYNA